MRKDIPEVGVSFFACLRTKVFVNQKRNRTIYGVIRNLLKNGRRAMKKPLTAAEYFDLICNRLVEKGLMPDEILDYRLSTMDTVPIRSYAFDIRNNLDYGESEGIYLDLAIRFYEDGEKKCRALGTFKTLHDTPEAMRIMAKLLADFIVEERAYVSANLDDFNWMGVDVYAVNEEGNRYGWGYSCYDMEQAMKRKDELLKKYQRVVIRDNATRKEQIYQDDK